MVSTYFSCEFQLVKFPSCDINTPETLAKCLCQHFDLVITGKAQRLITLIMAFVLYKFQVSQHTLSFTPVILLPLNAKMFPVESI